MLFKYDQVINTPHLGASTKEAQLRAGVQTAEQVALALKGQFAPNAVNVPFSLGEEADEVMPFVGLCELLGKLIVQLSDNPLDEFDVAYEGAIARHDTQVLSMAVLQGAAGRQGGGRGQLRQRGRHRRGARSQGARDQAAGGRRLPEPDHRDGTGQRRASSRSPARPWAASTGRASSRSTARTWTSSRRANMVFLRYDDVPGMLGKIGTRMGEFGINIAQMSVGRSMVDRKAIMGLTIDSPISREQVAELVRDGGAARRPQGGAVGGVGTL